jgi:predicted flap endonuclease-1-like 5' DNA nuclease
MPYKVTAIHGLKNFAKGDSWRRGDILAEGYLAPEWERALLAEGAIEPVDVGGGVTVTPRPEPEPDEPSFEYDLMTDEEMEAELVNQEDEEWALAIAGMKEDEGTEGSPMLDDLTALRGVGEEVAQSLIERGLDSYAAIAEAPVSTLVRIPRVGRSRAMTIKEQASALATT